MALRKTTGQALQRELDSTLDSINARAAERKADVLARLAELEEESAVLGVVLNTTASVRA